MKFTILSATVVAASAITLATSAMADGPGPRGSIKDAPFVAPFSWTGFYAGVNAGYAWGESDVSNSFQNNAASYFGPIAANRFSTAGSGPLDSGSFTGGAQIGYNIQSGVLVYGVEADFNYLGYKASRSVRSDYNNPPAGTGVNIRDEVSADYLATVRARLGYAAGSTLIYVTGGLAVTNLKHTHSVGEFGFGALAPCGAGSGNFCDLGGSSSSIRTGWTIGGGGEYALNRNWTLKAEYLYADLGKTSSSSSMFFNGPPLAAVANSAIGHSADLIMHTARVGLNYKF